MVSELPEAEFVEHIRPAIEAHVLIESDISDRLRFSHALIRAALSTVKAWSCLRGDCGTASLEKP